MMMNFSKPEIANADEPVRHEEKRLATWGTDVPNDIVLDKKLLDEALKKVSTFHLILSVSFCQYIYLCRC